MVQKQTCAVCKASVALLKDKRRSPEKVFGNRCPIGTGKELQRFTYRLSNSVLFRALPFYDKNFRDPFSRSGTVASVFIRGEKKAYAWSLE